MGTDLLEQPTKDNQQEYDKEPERKPAGNTEDKEPEEKSLSPEALEDAESQPSSDGSEESADSSADKEDSWVTSLTTQSRRANFKSTRKKLIVGGSIGAIVVGAIISIMSFMMPFFLTHIMESIESRVGQVPQSAIERRMDYYMNRYLMMRIIGNTGPSIEGDRRFVYLGDGFIKTIYTNWRGAKIEKQMINSGITLQPLENGELSRNGMRADRWRKVDLNLPEGHPDKYVDLDLPEAKAFIKDYNKRSTSSHRLWKRHNNRNVMRRYFGVPNWRLFEEKREEGRKSYRDRKVEFKKKMVNRVTGRITAKVPVWLDCLLRGREACRNHAMNRPETPSPDADKQSNPDTDQAIEDGTPVDGDDPPGNQPGDVDLPGSGVPDVPGGADEGLMRVILDIVVNQGLIKLLAGLAGAASFLNMISHIVESVDSGAINSIIYNRAIQQYSAFAAPALSVADQVRSGEDFDEKDLRVAFDMYKNFQKSPVYQATTQRAEETKDKKIRRDCNNDGDTQDSEDLLAQGELVCPDKKAMRDVTKFTDTDIWQALAGLSGGWRDTFGRVFDWIDGISSAVTGALGIDSVISSILSALHIQEGLASAFKWLINAILGPVVSGAEVGQEAYDATYAGVDGVSSSAGGGIGDRTAEDYTIGGGVLNAAQVTAIKEDMQEARDYELKNMSVFARYFSPDVPESLTSYAIISNPGTSTNALQRFAGIFNVSSFGSLWNNLASQKVSAAETNDNPFGYLSFGFANDHPIFADNNGDGMDPDKVRKRYKCDKPPEDRPQNKTFGRPMMENGKPLPFEVQLEADPCMLEEAVVKAATMRFTGTYDDDIDGGDSAGANGAPPTGTVTAEDIVAIPGFSSGCHESIAQNVIRMVQAAAADGVTLTGGCWRSSASQIALRQAHCGTSYYAVYQMPSSSCSPPTAIPGTSMHERGLAIDFENCSHGSACFIWLSEHADEYGLFNLESESWHWSTTGG